MPNFGFNPFAPRINVYTTGVETGDARRYYSRDVIRTGGEKVDIDATLTPGEAGKHQKTLFERKITEMVEKEKEFSSSGGRKLEFVNGERIQSSEASFFGLKSYQEYKQLKEEEKRRQELSLYHLSDKDIDVVIKFERENNGSSSIPSAIKQLYERIDSLKQQYEINQASSENAAPLYEQIDQHANDFLSFQRIKNPILIGHNNSALKKAEEGIVESHLPRVNMKVVLDTIDHDYIRQHPIIKEDIEKERARALDCNIKRVHLSNERFLNVNIPLEGDQSKPEVALVNDISDEFIQSHKLSTEEMSCLPQMKKYSKGTPNSTLFIRNLPKSVSCQELISLFGRYEDKTTSPIQYTILTGRMKGQAFVTLNSCDIAAKALDCLHGFVYKNKPLIIQYKNVD